MSLNDDARKIETIRRASLTSQVRKENVCACFSLRDMHPLLILRHVMGKARSLNVGHSVCAHMQTDTSTLATFAHMLLVTSGVS